MDNPIYKLIFMKQIFCLIAIISFSLVASAFSSNYLGVSITSVRPLSRVVIDGRTYRPNSDKIVEINNLRQGYRTINIYVISSGRSIYHDQLLYSDRIFFRAGYYTDIIISRSGRAYIDSEKMVMQGWEFDYPNYGNDYNGHKVMDATAFQQLKSAIQNESFEQTRKSILQGAIMDNAFETLQVKELLNLFNFEDSKLEFAKRMYNVTVDKEKYGQVYHVFNFSSSKEALSKFILEQRDKHDEDEF